MCGIVGISHRDPRVPVSRSDLEAMNLSQRHRGPDDEGYGLFEGTGIAMTRLSIIDLEGGHQPIANETGTIHVVCNGEIYNYVELRQELERRGHVFRTSTDVETLVHAYEEFGDRFVDHLNGMFAIALWDSERSRLVLARDRIGKKPLHYWEGPDAVVFGSEIKSVIRHPEVNRQPDWEALLLLLQHNFVPGPRTAWAGICELPPGCLGVLEAGVFRVHRFWCVPVPTEGVEAEGSSLEEVEALLEDVVRIRIRSDVPVGVFLSGGIDSSLVAVVATDLSGANSIATFSIGFPGSRFDESQYSREAADVLGTDHRELSLEPSHLTRIYSRVIEQLDEPFGDTSYVPYWYLSEFAANSHKVVLTGDGGTRSSGVIATIVTYLPTMNAVGRPVGIGRSSPPTRCARS